MGYTHYYYRPEVLDEKKFNLVIEDFRKVLPKISLSGVKLAGGDGRGVMTVSNEAIWLNGVAEGAHETFYLPLHYEKPSWHDQLRVDGKEEKLAFQFCKTAQKPYDIAVTCGLVIFKHHFGDAVRVHSDGDLSDWAAAILLCESVLRYGKDFKLDKED